MIIFLRTLVSLWHNRGACWTDANIVDAMYKMMGGVIDSPQKVQRHSESSCVYQVRTHTVRIFKVCVHTSAYLYTGSNFLVI